MPVGTAPCGCSGGTSCPCDLNLKCIKIVAADPPDPQYVLVNPGESTSCNFTVQVKSVGGVRLITDPATKGLYWDTVTCHWYAYIERYVDGEGIVWQGIWVGGSDPTNPYATYSLLTALIGTPPSDLDIEDGGAECPTCNDDECPNLAYLETCPQTPLVRLNFTTGGGIDVHPTRADGDVEWDASFTFFGRNYLFLMKCDGALGAVKAWEIIVTDVTNPFAPTEEVWVVNIASCCPPDTSGWGLVGGTNFNPLESIQSSPS